MFQGNQFHYWTQMFGWNPRSLLSSEKHQAGTVLGGEQPQGHTQGHLLPVRQRKSWMAVLIKRGDE
jgi:hypothetical protein